MAMTDIVKELTMLSEQLHSVHASLICMGEEMRREFMVTEAMIESGRQKGRPDTKGT